MNYMSYTSVIKNVMVSHILVGQWTTEEAVPEQAVGEGEEQGAGALRAGACGAAPRHRRQQRRVHVHEEGERLQRGGAQRAHVQRGGQRSQRAQPRAPRPQPERRDVRDVRSAKQDDAARQHLRPHQRHVAQRRQRQPQAHEPGVSAPDTSILCTTYMYIA